MKGERKDKRKTQFFKFVITKPHPIFAEQIYEKIKTTQRHATTFYYQYTLFTPQPCRLLTNRHVIRA